MIRPLTLPEMSSTRSITLQYMLAIGLIATALLSSYIFLQAKFAASAKHGKVINDSGRQRSLSQRIAYYSHLLQQPDLSQSEIGEYQAELYATINLMRESQNKLVAYLQSETIPQESYEKLTAIYFEEPYNVIANLEIFFESARAIASSKIQNDTSQHLKVVSTLSSDILLSGLDKAVKQYEQAYEAKIVQFQAIETGVLVVGLSILLLEIMFIFRPMTRKITTQMDDLKQANDELENFAYIASHDLKAPLRGIDNLAIWIVEDIGDDIDESVKEKLGLLRSRITRMENMLSDILQFSRAGRKVKDPKDIDLNKLLPEIVEMVNVPDGFHVSLPAQMPTIHSSETPLEQIFINTIGNAIKHHDKDKGHINIECIDRGQNLEFSIQDDGPGISEEYHEKVFQMFQTLKPRDQVEGTGLGMPIIKKLIEWQDGRVWIESTQDRRGTIIKFTWPKKSKNYTHDPERKAA